MILRYTHPSVILILWYMTVGLKHTLRRQFTQTYKVKVIKMKNNGCVFKHMNKSESNFKTYHNIHYNNCCINLSWIMDSIFQETALLNEQVFMLHITHWPTGVVGYRVAKLRSSVLSACQPIWQTSAMRLKSDWLRRMKRLRQSGE